MKLLRQVAVELVGMFVDDGNLALLTLALIALVSAAVVFFRLSALWGGVLLLAGCVAILADSVWKATRR